MTRVHVATFADLDTVTLYAILRLRADVFIVEQDCAYPDIDGRDQEAATRHVWLTTTGAGATGTGTTGTGTTRDPVPSKIVAYLRILDEPDGAARIGRVCVARDARRAGYAATLTAAALDVIGARDAVLDAQTYATKLYEDAGFVPDGAGFVEDGIPHLPMRRRGHARPATMSPIERRRPV